MCIFRGMSISHDDVIAALKEFDDDYPDANDYDAWLDKGNYKWEVNYNCRPYPPKYILSRVSGIDTYWFSGGEDTNRVFKQLNFEVKGKRYRPRRPS